MDWLWAFRPENANAVAGIGFWSALVSLVVTVPGFAITIYQIMRTRSAADAAKREAERIQKSFQQYEAVNEVTRGITALNHTLNLARKGTWEQVPDNYETVRASFEALRAVDLDHKIKEKIDGACEYIQRLSVRIERGLQNQNSIRIDAAKTISVMRDHVLILDEIKRVFEARAMQ